MEFFLKTNFNTPFCRFNNTYEDHMWPKIRNLGIHVSMRKIEMGGRRKMVWERENGDRIERESARVLVLLLKSSL